MSKKNLAKGGGIAATIVGIIVAVFAVEGGYVNNKNDPGGATNHGITEAVAREHGYTGHMKDLPKETAFEIYEQDYITKPGYRPVIELAPAVGHKLVDIGVNAGPSRSSRWFQTSINMLNRNGQDCPNVGVDGKVGPRTIQSYECLVRVRGSVKTCQMTLKLLDAQQATHYMNLANGDPKFKTFMVGWVDNRVGNIKLDECT